MNTLTIPPDGEPTVLAPGCYIDCSHLSAHDLNIRVIRFAESLGWTGGTHDLRLIHSAWDNYDQGNVPLDWDSDEEDFVFEYRDALDWACDDAVDWLNDDSFGPENVYWTIDDNCLYLWEDKNENL